MLGVDFGRYENFNSEVKPKYGSIRLKPSSGIENDMGRTSQYGHDIFVFKEASINDRVTVFPGDSLNHYTAEAGMESLRKDGKRTWHTLFMPWSRRKLLVPFLTQTIKYKSPFGRPQYDQFSFNLKDQRIIGHDYWEVQILGPIDFRNVAYFEFESQPPSGQFLEELKKQKIPIYDARQRPAVLWQGQ